MSFPSLVFAALMSPWGSASAVGSAKIRQGLHCSAPGLCLQGPSSDGTVGTRAQGPWKQELQGEGVHWLLCHLAAQGKASLQDRP